MSDRLTFTRESPIPTKIFSSRVERAGSAVLAVLESGRLSGGAAVLSEYEASLARYFDIPYAVAVNSGSSALFAALSAAALVPGDEVIVPAIAPIPTVLPITVLGAVPVFCDIAVGSVEYSRDDLLSVLSPRARAIIMLPLWGYPVERPEIPHNGGSAGDVPVIIEDAAHAHGTRVEDRLVGTLGDIGCFSTHDQKLVATGEGGFVITKDRATFEWIESFTRLGHLEGLSPAVNFKLSALPAACGIAELADLDARIVKRREWAKRYHSLIEPIDGVAEISAASRARPNYYCFTIYGPRVDAGFRDRLARVGILSDQIRYSFAPPYARRAFQMYSRSCPNAEDLIEHSATLPVVPELGERVLDYVCTAVERCFQE